MEKEKMIDEMAKEIVRMAGGDVYQKAEYLIEQGYRKIPEGVVVLTKEEYERLKRIENEKDRLYEIKLDLENQLIEKGWTDYEGADEIEKRARKEMAEEFAERLKDKFNNTEYRAKTKRKTISIEELKAQMDWILHEVVIKNIDETLKDSVNIEE